MSQEKVTCTGYSSGNSRAQVLLELAANLNCMEGCCIDRRGRFAGAVSKLRLDGDRSTIGRCRFDLTLTPTLSQRERELRERLYKSPPLGERARVREDRGTILVSWRLLRQLRERPLPESRAHRRVSQPFVV